MYEQIVVDSEYVDIEIVGETLLASVEVVGIEIVEVSESGPKGENADASFEWVTQVFDLANSQQEFELNFEPRLGSVFVYLNGLLERFWSIAGTTITLDDSARAGDSILINYQKEI